MIEVIRAAAELQKVCEQQAWRFCFIGGLALLRWGEPRETVDADLTLLTGFGNELPFVELLLSRFAGRMEQAQEFALKHRVLLLRAKSGVGLDIALGGLPFESSAVARCGSWLVRSCRRKHPRTDTNAGLLTRLIQTAILGECLLN